MADPAKRHITILIDRSGSMARIQDATQEGLNGFLEEQAREDKKQGLTTRVTILHFDWETDVVIDDVPIAEVTGYTLEPRGATALLDALVTTFTQARERRLATPKDERPGIEHYLIVTDGDENSSSRYAGKYAEVAKMIRTEEKRKGRVIQYMGANQDAIATASKIGIRSANSITYAANAVGTHSSWESVSATASAGAAGGSYAFTKDMRARAMGNSDVFMDHPDQQDVVGQVDKPQEDDEQ